MNPARTRSLGLIAGLSLLVLGMVPSLHAAPPLPTAPLFLSETPAVATSPCTNELPGWAVPAPASSTPLAAAGEPTSVPLLGPVSCGEQCHAACERFCGVGLGRCYPLRHCACECW
jgi:hypothetical protein